ncbi:TonB-dependent siderophore receptor [Lysobacter sp. Root690]|uniref:TonB-dependent siderophore receptor n=1 Tax=Lysobacter sp. Root690 TaxID=1736588 RepID=UPI000AA38E70|nr:TonB-dependent siderophore receptor [Lysobacter sp. Root690]
MSATRCFRAPARSPLFLSVLLVLSLPFAAAAQSSSSAPADDAQTLDAVRVNAYRVTSHAQGATKTDTSVAETPQSIAVIAREELDARGVQNLNEAMRYVAGVSLESGGIDNRVDDFRIRGYDAGSWSNNVTLDGMRAPQGSQWNRTMFDSWNLERVEVLKGPSAVMYGQVAPGGMVNQVSKTPQPDQQQVLQLGLDAHGQYSAAFDVGTAMADDAHLLRLVGLYRDGDTQIDHTEQKHWFLAPSYSWQMGERTRLTVLGLYQKDEGGSTYQFLPMDGTLVATRYGRMKNSTFIGEPNWNTFNRDIWTAGWLFEHAFNDHWSLSQSARRTHVESLFRTVVTSGALNPDGRTQNRRATWGEGESDGDTVDTRVQGKFRTGALAHTLIVGVDWQKADWNGGRGAMSNPAPIDIFKPVYTGYVPVTRSVGLSRGVNEQFGAYLQDQVAVGNWRFLLGGRYDRTDDDTATATYTVATGRTTPWARTRLKNEAFTGRAGVLYAAANGWSPYLSYAESFQPPTTDINQSHTRTPFDPITGKQWEGGIKFQPSGFDGLITLSAYDLRQQNILTDDPDPTHVTCGSTGASRCQVQSGEGRVRGLELEGRVTPLEGFSIIGAASRMDSEITRGTPDVQGKQLSMVPDWTASIWADYTLQRGALQGLGFAAGVRHNGESYGDSANLYRIPSYTVFDAAIRYRIEGGNGPSTQFALNIGNLSDKTYVSTCGGVSSCFYATGRTVVASVRFGW